MDTLRSRLIRLAKVRPTLRAYLLPLLKTASTEIRPFTDGDWMSYGGSVPFVDDTDPLIAEKDFNTTPVEVRLPGGGIGLAYFVTVVADGEGVSAMYSGDDFDPISTYALKRTLRNQEAGHDALDSSLPALLRGQVPRGFLVTF